MSMFRSDSPLVKWLTKLANLIFVSGLWCLFSLPVLTIVPASAALHHSTVHIIHGKGVGVVRDFWQSFRENLKQGIPLSILCVVSGLMLLVCVWFGWNNLQTLLGCFYFALGLVLLLIWALTVQQLPAVLTTFDDKTGVLLRLAGYLSALRPWQSVLTALLVPVLLFACWFLPILIFLAPGLYADLCCRSKEKAVQKLMDRLGIAREADKETAAEALAEAEEESGAHSALELEKRLG